MQLGIGCVEDALLLCVQTLRPGSTECVASSTTTTLRPVAAGEDGRCSLAAAVAGAAGSWRTEERRCPSLDQLEFEAQPATATRAGTPEWYTELTEEFSMEPLQRRGLEACILADPR